MVVPREMLLWPTVSEIVRVSINLLPSRHPIPKRNICGTVPYQSILWRVPR